MDPKGTKPLVAAPQRFVVVGQTPHRHEIEGVDWLRSALPTYGPFGGWALFSFQTDDGRRYEIDAIALTAHCLYVIEMKSWGGRVVDGDVRHLVTSSPQRGREVVDHPLPLLETKTKTFAARVRRVARSLGRDVAEQMDRLWFDSLVWLTHANETDLGAFDAARAHLVLGRAEIGDALRQARFPGARDDLATRTVTHDTLKQLRKVLQADAFGLDKIQKPPTVLGGTFRLARLVGEGDDYQDHIAAPQQHEALECRVRSYLAPSSDRAFVDKLERRVRREYEILHRLGEHPDILAVRAFDPAGPLGPAIVLDGFQGKPLDAFVKERRTAAGRSDLSLDDKLAILRRVADALTFCHRNDVVHGALSPEAVLVLRKGESLAVKLTRFALAAAGDAVSDGTRLFTRLAGASANVYEAPEVARGGTPTPAGDLFSLAALAYFLLTEEAPALSAAELSLRLERDRGLVLSAVRDDLFPGGTAEDLDAVLLCATEVDPLLRAQGFTSPRDFVDRLEEALTAPDAGAEPPPPEPPAAPVDPDPLHATKGTLLAGGIEVLAELGSGATARVFKVRHPVQDVVALKVPLSERDDERIAQEWKVLERLGRIPGVDRIARGIDTVALAGRTCLLVQLAGDRTLADEIRTEGALSLDYARRWGDDLLTALRSLEEAGVQHRDIKPANIGLTSGTEKGRKRLLLFDFSLSHRPADEIGIGTPAYKDPELPSRARWDDAADRWAAAVTLHEMFTGVRPAPVPPKALAPAVRLAPERFDADVRDGLVRFFERCFQSAAKDRFAAAEDMRDAFIDALHKVPEHDGRGAAAEPALTVAQLQGHASGASVGLLPLSTRQRNALDRMGVYTLEDLAQLSSNRLGAVRGVGAQTARSLVALAATVREYLEISAVAPPSPFFRSFAGARRAIDDEVESGRLGAVLARRFLDAGLTDSAAVASAPHAHVKNLVARARKEGAPEALKDVTAWLEGLVDAEKAPTTLGAAVLALLPTRGQKGPGWLRRARIFYGLAERDGYPRFGTKTELAVAEGVSHAAISLDLAKARDAWGAPRTLPGLSLDSPSTARGLGVLARALPAVAAALDASGGVVPIARAAAAVIDVLPPEADLGPADVQRYAEAIVRALTEVDAAHVDGSSLPRPRLRRIARDQALVAWERSGFDLAQALGEQADALVAEDRVVAESEAASRLREALGVAFPVLLARGSVAFPDRSVVALAAATAERARLSARGELYPEGLAAARALQWSAAAVASRVELSELQRRVRARYPEAASFPEDPDAIERLAASLSLRFDREQAAFVPRERGSSVTVSLMPRTSASAGAESPAPEPPPAPEDTPAAGAAPQAGPVPEAPPAFLFKERSEGDIRGASAMRVFDEELERTRREGGFRVLLWRGRPASAGRPAARGAPDAEIAAGEVARRIGGEVCKLDERLITSAQAVAVEKKLRGLEPAIEADRLGPSGKAWSRLTDLMRLASTRAIDELPAERPRVLVRLGLLARYDLLSTIADLASAHRGPGPSGAVSGGSTPGRQATFVVLPVFSGEGPVVEVQADVARAGNVLVPVPGLLRHELLEVPSVWLDRRTDHRSASSPSFPAVRG